MSFEKVYFDFENKCYVIRADNQDNSGQTSNGGGKTSFVDTIAIALLGYSLTGRNIKDCVNWNGGLDYFTIDLLMVDKDRNQECAISRKIYSGKSSGELSILLNGKVPSTLPTKAAVVNGVDVKEGNKYILQNILDIAEDDLLNYFLISKKQYNPFLEINTDRKLEVIGRFTNTKAVDKVLQSLNNDLEITQDDINELNDRVTSGNGYIAALQDSMNQDHKAEFNKQKKQAVAAIKSQIEAAEKEIFDIDRELSEHRLEITRLESTVIDINDDEVNKIINECLELSCEDELLLKKELSGEIAHVENHLAGLITCPKCEHQFNLDGENFTEDHLNQLKNDLDVVCKMIEEKEKHKEEIDRVLAVVNDSINKNKNIALEIASHNRNIKSIEKQQERLIEEYAKTVNRLEQESAKTFTDQRVDIGKRIAEKKREIEAFTVQLEELKVELDRKSKWIEHFNNFKFYLGNKPTSIICTLVNQYLKLSGSDLNLHIEGFKKLKGGEIRQALTPVVYRNWINPQSVAQFSEGERVRLNVSVDLAFQQLINGASKTGGLNLYVNDELISGLDSLGVQLAAQAFEYLDKTMLLVTHSGADINYENTITIRKKNNKSELI